MNLKRLLVITVSFLICFGAKIAPNEVVLTIPCLGAAPSACNGAKDQSQRRQTCRSRQVKAYRKSLEDWYAKNIAAFNAKNVRRDHGVAHGRLSYVKRQTARLILAQIWKHVLCFFWNESNTSFHKTFKLGVIEVKAT